MLAIHFSNLAIYSPFIRGIFSSWCKRVISFCAAFVVSQTDTEAARHSVSIKALLNFFVWVLYTSNSFVRYGVNSPPIDVVQYDIWLSCCKPWIPIFSKISWQKLLVVHLHAEPSAECAPQSNHLLPRKQSSTPGWPSGTQIVCTGLFFYDSISQLWPRHGNPRSPSAKVSKTDS